MSNPSLDDKSSQAVPSKRVIEDEPAPGLSTISKAIADIAAGKMVILVDDEDRHLAGGDGDPRRRRRSRERG